MSQQKVASGNLSRGASVQANCYMMSPFDPFAWRRVLRLQRRAPAGAVLIVVTLALGIGASVTVFSVADPLILRPLPFPEPEALVVVSSSFPRMQLAAMGLSGPEALEVPQLTTALSAVGQLTFGTVTVRPRTDSLRASAALASASVFDTLRPVLALGRPFTPEEDRPGGPLTAVLSDGFWRRAFGASRDVVGGLVEVDGRATRIVGVLPPRTELLNRSIDIWLPLRLSPATAGSRADHRYTVVARRKPGVPMAAAAADLAAAVARWQTATGEFHSPAPGVHPLEMRRLSEATSGAVVRPLAALAASVGLVLLIACANVANLMLARAEGRRADLAIELALGAGIRHLAGLYLAEAIVLAALGGAGGLALAAIGIDALKAFGPALVKPDDIVLNARVLAFAAAAAVATAALIAVAPVLRVDAMRARHGLPAGGRGAIGAGDRGRLQHLLVAVQIALAVALSVGGLLTVRSLLALARVDAGFRADAVLRAQISLPDASYAADEQVWDFYDRLLQRARTLPGVREAAAMSGLPPIRPANNTTFVLDGAVMLDHANIPQVEFIQHVSPGYFTVMGVPLRAGRAFTNADTAAAAPVAIVNETLARRFWPGQSALGHRLRPAGLGAPWFVVVGVAGDVRQAGLQVPAGAELYVPHRQGRVLLSTFMPRGMNLVVAADGDLLSVAPALSRLVRDLDAAAAVSGVGPMSDAVSRAIAQPRLLTALLTAFAGLAVALAAVGVYGVAAGAVAARTAEFGVRIALGATPRDVIGQVLRSHGAAIGTGLAAGCAVARLGTQYLASLLYDVPAWTPAPLAAAAAILLAVALAAIAIPAIRATRIDPLEALRTS